MGGEPLMARSYAAIHHRIWADPEWRTLDVNAQHLYMLLISQPQMNLAGVLPLQLRKWASCVAGWDIADVAKALDQLRDARFVLVDEDTEEVLVRTLIRNDGSYRIPNVLKSLLQAAEGTQASTLRAELAAELGRLDPLDGKKADECAAWIVATRRILGATDGPSGPGGEPLPEPFPEGLAEGFPVTVPRTVNQPFPEPLPQRSGSGSGSGSLLALVDFREGERASPPPNEPSPCRKHEGMDPDAIPPCRACGRRREQWEAARAEAAKPKPPPPWCGNCCHPTDRHIDTPNGVIRCPDCNPLAMESA